MTGDEGDGAASSYDLELLTWPEVGRILARESRMIFAVGALEQHGPHLPLGTNTFIADRVATALSRRLGILRGPTIPHGVSLPGHQQFAGTVTLRRKTLHRVVNELLAGWEGHGVTEFIVITAHRYEPHLDAVLMALTNESIPTVVDLYAVDVSDLVDGTMEWEHAGEVETSLMLHLAPDRVRTDRIADFVPDEKTYRKYIRGRAATPPPGSTGAVGRPTRASADKGERIFRRYLETLERTVFLRPGEQAPVGVPAARGRPGEDLGEGMTGESAGPGEVSETDLEEEGEPGRGAEVDPTRDGPERGPATGG